MCGICGFNFEDRMLIKKMSDLIFHRGPDNEGFFIDNEISLGMRRLAIIDLKKGDQPQHNEEEDIWVVFNGEIYNFAILRRELEFKGHIFYTNSDTEVIIHAYEEWGEKFLKKLRGQFAFCIYDSKKRNIFLARDALGLKPLYYYFDGEKFIFSSEIKCILAHKIKKEINRKAFGSYISLGYTFSNLTLFKNIYKVPPSSYLIFNLNNSNLRIKKFWNLDFNIDKTKTEAILSTELRNLLEESVKIRLMSEVPLGVFLSGGLDSSSIVALMNKFSDNQIQTFSIRFEEGAPVDETSYANLVSDYYNTNHTELLIKSSVYEILPKLVWHFDDLIADPAIIPVYFMAKLAREKITVALTGDGADEIFAGYSEKYWLYGKRAYEFIPQKFYSLIPKIYNFVPSYKFQTLLS
ncbi:hypothetical protein LCGC14_1918240, partial [marine sediment metagenome]